MKAANLLGNYFGKKRLKFATFFVPTHNDKLIIFKFSNPEDRDKVLEHPNFEREILGQANCKIYVNPNTPSPEKFQRMIFVFRLNPIQFYSENETLSKTLEIYKQQIIDSQPEGAVEDIHLHQHSGHRGRLLPPRTMILTFKDLGSATTFLKEDTYLEMGMILSTTKKWHNHIQRRQCGCCKATNHRRGNKDLCDGILRCARCLSKNHSKPTPTCEPQCWTHGKGHSSGSEKCSIIIAYKKKMREIHDAKERIENQTSKTPAEYQQLHKDILKVQASSSNSNSYASKLRGGNQASNHAGLAATPVFQAQASQFNTNVYAAAYVAACISEAHDPGSFQEVMDDFGKRNKMPIINYPTPRLGVLKALAPDASAVKQAIRQAESVRHEAPARPTEQTPDSEDDDLGLPDLSHIHYSQTPSSSRPSSWASSSFTASSGAIHSISYYRARAS